ncbi:MAG: GGDEF domain-containing protein [Burkholderiaceae bacterium]
MAHPRLIESLADITACRDRDEIEVAVLSVMFEMLRPVGLKLFRPVDPAGRSGVLRSAIGRYVGNGELEVVVSDPVPVGLERMPSGPRRRASDDPTTSQPKGEYYSTSLPIVGDTGPIGWIEAETALALEGEQHRLVSGLLRIYANHLAVLDYGEHDTLTGLRNRKTFDTLFLKRLAEMRLAGGDPHWIGVIDIDHFKRINDRYGHLFGDEVLMLIARIMRAAFAPAEILYRFGGEEFVVQMSAATPPAARGAFDILRQRVAQYCFPQVGQVTVSVGFTPIERNDTPSSAFDRADEALYEAKKQGRNRCIASRAGQDGRMSAGPTVQGEVLLF